MKLIDIVSTLALIGSVMGNFLVNSQRRSGFVIWLFANVLWIFANIFGVFNWQQVLMFVIYTGLNIHGIWKWTKLKRAAENEFKGSL